MWHFVAFLDGGMEGQDAGEEEEDGDVKVYTVEEGLQRNSLLFLAGDYYDVDGVNALWF